MAGLYVNRNIMCYVHNTYCLRHFKFAIFLKREIRQINVSKKVSCNKVSPINSRITSKTWKQKKATLFNT